MKIPEAMINPSEIANIARAEESLWWFRGMRAISFALLDPVIPSNGLHRVLEAGCGTGFFATALQKRYKTEVVAVDLASEAMRYCRERHAPYLTQASVVSLPFGDATFDLVASMDVLPHFAHGEERTAFQELVRVLRPQGLLLLRAAALNVFRSRHSKYVWEGQRFTKKRLEALARENGLEILRLTYANFFLTPVAFLKFRLYEPLTGRPLASGIPPIAPLLDHLLYLPLALERWWLSRGWHFPWGQSLFLLGRKN